MTWGWWILLQPLNSWTLRGLQVASLRASGGFQQRGQLHFFRSAQFTLQRSHRDLLYPLVDKHSY